MTSKLILESFVGALKRSGTFIAAAGVAKSDHVMTAHSATTACRCPALWAMAESAQLVER